VYRRKKEEKRRRESGIYPFHLFQAFHKGGDMTTDPFACCEIECPRLERWTLHECEEARCCWTYVRRREEDAIERERKDAKARENVCR
jgi:hypothetical protein